MKILNLTLINFSRIFSGLEKTKLEIDFTNINNKINLFVGSNGTGKTSIMSCLHPFAYNSATGDSTANSDLIIEGKDGKKIVIIQDNDNLYEIEHVYSRKKDGSINVRSYVKENDVQLNDSGTVSTFKTIIQDKLGIDQTYLTLLSIGNTVKGFVDFTASDRKNYASKIFTELEIYAKHYKNLTSLDRSMKTLLNNVVSKLSRYSNVNKEQLRARIQEIDILLSDLNNKKIQFSQSIGGVNNQLANYQNTISEYSNFQQELASLSQQIALIRRNNIVNYTLKNARDAELLIIETKDKLQEKSVELANLKTRLGATLDMKESKESMLQNVEDNLSKMTGDNSWDELNTYRQQLESDIAVIYEMYDVNARYDLTKDEMIKAVIYLDELQNICHNFMTDVVNKDNIIPLFNKYRNNPNIINATNNQYQDAVADLQQFSSIANSSIIIKAPIIRGDCTDEHCPYKSFYENYCYAVNHSNDSNANKILELEKRVGQLSDSMTILSIIQKCFNHIKKYENILSKAGIIFDKDSFVSRYMETKTIYDSEESARIIDAMENIEIYNNLRSKISDLDKQMRLLSSNNELCKALNHNKECLIDEIETLGNTYTEMKSQYDALYEEVERLTNLCDSYTSDYNHFMKIKELEDRAKEIRDKILSMETMICEVNELKYKLQDYNDEIGKINRSITELTHERNELNVSLSNIETLQSEEIELRNKYDLVSNVRSALSPTTGIPLEFIEYYIKEEIIGRINELLDSVYYGRLRLLKDEVVIDDSSFTIPYIKNSTTIVKDISKASDGERAILSIAFSLVLIQLSSNKYNIMLLDEIDTSLDNESRGKFIDMLESYMYIIKAEQLFLISHNNMFDSYPVCVLMTSDYNGLNFSEATMYKLCN